MISHFAILGTVMSKSDFKSSLKHIFCLIRVERCLLCPQTLGSYFISLKTPITVFPDFPHSPISIKFPTSEFSTSERNLIFSRGYFPEQCRQWTWHHFQCKTYNYISKHRKNCEGCPGHYLIVNRYSSMSWFKFPNLSVIVYSVTKSLIH